MRKLLHATVGCAAALMLGAVPVKAELLQQSWEPFLFVPAEANPCLGEVIRFEGRIHTTITSMPRGNLGIHFNIMGTGTGQTTGNVWVYRDNWTNILPSNDPLSWTIKRNIRLIGRGGLASSTFTRSAHFTVIDGVPAVEFDEIEFVCRD